MLPIPVHPLLDRNLGFPKVEDNGRCYCKPENNENKSKHKNSKLLILLQAIVIDGWNNTQRTMSKGIMQSYVRSIESINHHWINRNIVAC